MSKTANKPYTCAYCAKPTAQPPHSLAPVEGEPARYMPSCCFACSQLDRWDAKPLADATPEELAVIQPMPPADAADTDKMPLAVTANVEATCPCGAEVAVSDGARPAVLHAMPQCKDFEERDPLAYLRWLNEKLEAAGRS
jgi:hypothetical protein